MKEIYVRHLISGDFIGQEKSISGWLANRRVSGKIIFLDFCDSTGIIQAVVSKSDVSAEDFAQIKKIPLESSINIIGIIQCQSGGRPEILVKSLTVIGLAEKVFSPRPRSSFDIFDPKMANHVLNNRHIYIRNPQVMAILKFRHIMMKCVRDWFDENNFLEIDAPILTPVPLYDDESAIAINVKGEEVFLTQCVGYYLESAVHAFEKVYNMGPSFRGEESRSKRHLMEYWHIKAEVAFADIEDIISIVESLISYITQYCIKNSSDIMQVLGTELCVDGLQIPYKRISYHDCIDYLRSVDFDIEFGKGFGSVEETALSKLFYGPFWITGIPAVVEPFPYSLNPNDKEITVVADLIASNGYGELLGTAEKIYKIEELDERMISKGKGNNPRYEWIRDVHQFGCVPHAAFGMGVERMIRWLLNISHVRDAIPFPRIFRRKIYP